MKSTMKSKEMTGKSATFAKGGNTKMAGQSGAAPVVAGQVSLGGRSDGNAFKVKAGRTGVMGKQGGAAPVIAGQVSSGGRSGDNSFSVKGGGSKMAGPSGASSARPR